MATRRDDTRYGCNWARKSKNMCDNEILYQLSVKAITQGNANTHTHTHMCANIHKRNQMNKFSVARLPRSGREIGVWDFEHQQISECKFLIPLPPSNTFYTQMNINSFVRFLLFNHSFIYSVCCAFITNFLANVNISNRNSEQITLTI